MATIARIKQIDLSQIDESTFKHQHADCINGAIEHDR